MPKRADIVVVGAGAAGLFAGLWAARRSRELARPRRILILDGARTLGAKILVAGGGRCNVTHCAVSERDFNGSTPGAIRSVLRRFTVEDTTRFFAQRTVQLKREPTGKLFPTTDRARDVLDAILDATREAGAVIRNPCRVEQVARADTGFLVHAVENHKPAEFLAKRLILATGGKALPKSGSDGQGYDFARALDHSVSRTFPALVPLILEKDHPLRALSGLSFEAALEVRAASSKRLAPTRGSVLCTHFGLSGPAILDISRHLTAARHQDPGAHLVLSSLPDLTRDQLDHTLRNLGPTPIARVLKEDLLPERLASTLLDLAHIPHHTTGATLTKDQRRALLNTLLELTVPVTSDRGYTHAEVTAGGVPLKELTLRTMESRCTPALHLCGEICDADGRIGGFNFQWAWASGYIAGTAAAEAIAEHAIASPRGPNTANPARSTKNPP